MNVKEAKTLLTDWTEWENDRGENWREVVLTAGEAEEIAYLLEVQKRKIKRLESKVWKLTNRHRKRRHNDV